jgi:tetratricopeptide (TPR) repeat protein
LLYNYNFEKGVNLISENNTDASKHLNNALKIRQILGQLDTFFDKKFFGLPPIFPSEMLTRRRLANSYRLNGNYQKALEEYEQVESFYNNNFDVIAGMADSYFKLLNVEKTEYYYEKLTKTERDNKDVNYYFHMGMAYVILMDCESAEMYLKKSIELGKDSKGVNRIIEKCKSGTIIDTGIYSREE